MTYFYSKKKINKISKHNSSYKDAGDIFAYSYMICLIED